MFYREKGYAGNGRIFVCCSIRRHLQHDTRYNHEDAILHTSYDCYRCVAGYTELCNNSNIIGLKKTVQSKTATNLDDKDDSITEDPIRLSDMIHKGTIFAVLCDDHEHDYYWVRAESSPHDETCSMFLFL